MLMIILLLVIFLLFIPLFFKSIIKKDYSTFFGLLGVGCFIYTTFYAWSVYEKNRNIVLSILLLTSLFLLLLIKLFSKINKDCKKNNKIVNYINWKSFYIIIFLVVIAFLISIFPRPYYKIKFYDSIEKSKLNDKLKIGYIVNEGLFMPKKINVGKYMACINNTPSPISFNYNHGNNKYTYYDNYLELSKNNENISIVIMYPPTRNGYNNISIYKLDNEEYFDCYNSNKKPIKVINIIKS